MSKFNTPNVRPASGISPVTSETAPSGVTHEGGAGFARDARSELYLLAITNFVGEATFYESAEARDARYRDLIERVVADESHTSIANVRWVSELLIWLRREGNLRTASLVGAAELVRCALTHGIIDAETGVDRGVLRRTVDRVCQRADEPGELLAYWFGRYGKRIPKPVKRGVADAALRLYNEYTLLKYDTNSHAFRFGDVIELTHPDTDAPWQGELFKRAIDRRHGRELTLDGNSLKMLQRNVIMRSCTATDAWLDPEKLAAAGLTWEDVLSALGSKVNKAKLWEALIPTMGYMALLRNLRNFDEAGVSDAVAAAVIARLADPSEVERSRQLPLRFLSAYRAAPSLRWSWTLEQALQLSLRNVPELKGNTLILVDTSGSMTSPLSARSELNFHDAAVTFGLALAARCEAADVWSFSSNLMRFAMNPSESLLRALERWRRDGFFQFGGTYTTEAARQTYSQHRRVVILTDEQATYDGAGPGMVVPSTVPLYTWNLAGYRHGHAPSGTPNRHAFGGLTDGSFKLIPLLERGSNASWPWEQTD